MNLPIKYRPIRFDQIVGQSIAVEIAKASLTQVELQTTYLLVGSSGAGKTTLARIMARSLNCTNRQGIEPCNQCDSCQAHLQDNHLAITEINGADKTGVDDVRDIIEKCQLHTISSKYRVLIVDECHQMSKPAQNAMLKLLEEPPTDTVFILCTTEEDRLLETIRSRARILRFDTVNCDLVTGYLLNVAHHEQIPLTETEAYLIYDYNKGSIRQCLQTLGTVSERVTVEDLCPQIPEAKLQSILLSFEARDYLAIEGILQELIRQRFYPKHILSKLIDYTIDLMSNPDTNKKFLINADQILQVLIPAINRLGNSSNNVAECRLTLYHCVVVWQPINQTADDKSELNQSQPKIQPDYQLANGYSPQPDYYPIPAQSLNYQQINYPTQNLIQQGQTPQIQAEYQVPTQYNQRLRRSY